MTQGDEPQGAHPARFWWLKRFALAAVGGVLLLAATWAAWGWEAERRMRRALDEIAAAGDPVRPEGVRRLRLPDRENGADYLIRAAAAVDPDADCPSSSATPFDQYPPYSTLWFQMADASVAASPLAFALARRARGFDHSQWDEPPNPKRGPSIFASMAGHPLHPIHHLANTLGDAALNMHAHGDDAAALETIRDGRHLARSAGAYPGMAGPMVARNHDTIATYRLQIIATGLRIAPEGRDLPDTADRAPSAPDRTLAIAHPPMRPATRAQVRALIAELLDEAYWASNLRPAMAVERAKLVEAGEWFAGRTHVLRPMVLLDLVRLLEGTRPYAEAAAQPTWPRAKAVFERGGAVTRPPIHTGVAYYPTVPPPPGTRRQPVDVARLLTRSDLVPMFDRAIEQDMRHRVLRRTTAVSLAAQLYRADHGAWPPHLSALAPVYLPAVPADPFAPDGAPLRYLLVKGALPDGRDRPVVYTVNLNGVDDTPDASALSSAPQFGWRRSRDAHLDLARWTPPASPTTQPSTAPAR